MQLGRRELRSHPRHRRVTYALGAADVGSRIVLRVRGTDETPVVGGFREADSPRRRLSSAAAASAPALPIVHAARCATGRR